MSSILKALKKIEQEESKEGSDAVAWPNSVQSTRQTLKEAGRKKLILASLVISCLLIVVGAVYLGSKMKRPDKNKPDNKLENKIDSVVNAPGKIENRTDKPVKKRGKTAGTNSIQGREFKTAGGQNQMDRKPPAVMSNQKDARTGTQNVMTGADSPTLPKNDGLPVMDTRAAEPGPRDAGQSHPEIKNDSRINIQAIAWAEEPGRRFVVINNTILKEGGSIDGITVVSIGDDIILLNENGNEWRQRFIVR